MFEVVSEGKDHTSGFKLRTEVIANSNYIA